MQSIFARYLGYNMAILLSVQSINVVYFARCINKYIICKQVSNFGHRLSIRSYCTKVNIWKMQFALPVPEQWRPDCTITSCSQAV